jgi:hypothetical protein
LVRSAWVRCLVGKRTAESEFLAEVKQVLSEARRLVLGETVEVPVLQAFAFVTLPAGRLVTSASGVLRGPSELETAHGGRYFPGSLSYNDDHGAGIFSYSGDLILDGSVPISTQVSDAPRPGLPAFKANTWEEMERRQLRISLAVTLAVERARPAVAVPTWTIILDPLSSVSGSMRAGNPEVHDAGPAALTEAEAASLNGWLEILDRTYSERTAMAARRIQSSIAERRDAADGLVDAVVAWESLFGSREGESTLRVSASLARLLGAGTARRHQLQKEAKKIYELRSRVVHGGTSVDQADAYRAWLRARDLGIQVLRCLYRDHPELLDLESGERSLQVLLGDLPPEAQA